MTPRDGTTDPIVAILRDALAKTTPGVWLIDTDLPDSTAPELVVFQPDSRGNARKLRICKALLEGGSEGITEARANARFIFLAKSLVPELIEASARLTSALAAADEQIAKAEDALTILVSKNTALREKLETTTAERIAAMDALTLTLLPTTPAAQLAKIRAFVARLDATTSDEGGDHVVQD